MMVIISGSLRQTKAKWLGFLHVDKACPILGSVNVVEACQRHHDLYCHIYSILAY